MPSPSAETSEVETLLASMKEPLADEVADVRHTVVTALAGVEDGALRSDIAHLLLDTARALDGERPADANAFAERLNRMFQS